MNTNCENIKNCYSCNYCNSCNFCNFCDSCNYCYYCNSCNSCNYCVSCYYCNFCDSCNFCNYCNYCKNLKMTEYNLFCYSENYNDENSFQQKRYRVFNKEVGKIRYDEILNKVKEILKDLKLELDNNSWSEEWKKVTKEQWKQLLEIPEAKDFKKGLEYISGVKIDLEEVDILIKNGRKYQVKIIKEL